MSALLLITPHFPPSAASGAFRMLGFAEHLPALGWQLSVVTRLNNPLEPTDVALGRRVPDSVETLRVAGPVDWQARVMYWVGRRYRLWDGLRPWVGAARPAIRRLLRSRMPDVVMTSGPPHSVHALGRMVKRATGAVWAADFRDPWVAGNWSCRSPTWLDSCRERTVVAEADLVISNAPQALAAYREHYPRYSDKFISITNGFDAAPMEIRTKSSGKRLQVLHAGEIYAARDPRPLLDAVERMQEDGRRISLQFVGRVEGMELAAEADRRGLGGHVAVGGQVSSAQASRAMHDADVLLLLDTPGRRIGVPAKLYEYIGSGRPVLALAERESDTAWALRESGAPHALAPPRDVEAIAAAVRKVIALANRPMQPLPPKAAQFERANLAVQLSDALRRLQADRQRMSTAAAKTQQQRLEIERPKLVDVDAAANG